MSKGPKMNKIELSDTSRDNLGIEGAVLTMQDIACPIVTTVTPRCFYWCFLTWIYYDLRNLGANKINNELFINHLRRQDYFFVLSTLLNNNSDQNNIAGKDRAAVNINNNTTDLFEFDDKYYKIRMGGMNYYGGGVFTLGLLSDHNNETEESYPFPRLTKRGEQLAIAFEAVIKNTRYYKEYRLNNKSVPKDVLIELGNTLNVGLIGFENVKIQMSDILFGETSNPKLIESYNYLKFLNKEYKISSLDERTCRNILYDYFSDRLPESKNYPFELKNIINQWEIVVGRQYMTVGIEAIWKSMLEVLNIEKNAQKWITDSINFSTFNFDVNSKLADLIINFNYSYEEREEMFIECRRGSNRNIQLGIQLILSVFNRFYERNDFSDETNYFLLIGDSNESISIKQMMDKVVEYFDKPIIQFIEYVLYEWCLKQHEKTAFSKMLRGEDAYFVEKVDGKYRKKRTAGLSFQGIRLVQLLVVMKDLNLLEVM